MTLLEEPATTGSKTSTYSYDAAGQMTVRTLTGADSETLTHGPRGLRLQSTVGSNATSYVYNDRAQVMTSTAPWLNTSYTYDADGRRTGVKTAGSIDTVTSYDARGLPAKTESTGLLGSFIETRSYDADRALTKQTRKIGAAGPTTRTMVADPMAPAGLAPVVRSSTTSWQRAIRGMGVVAFRSSGAADPTAIQQNLTRAERLDGDCRAPRGHLSWLAAGGGSAVLAVANCVSDGRLVHTGGVDEIEIRDDVIRLGQLLKLASLIEVGGEGKIVLEEGRVRVNGEVETRRGRQVHPGDEVALDEQQVRVVRG